MAPMIAPELVPPAAVTDIGTAQEMAGIENQGHNILAESGLTALGDTYLSYETEGGPVVATVREAMTVCPHIGRLTGDKLVGFVELMRIDPTPEEINPNLHSPSA